MEQFSAFQPPERLLMGPGPSDVEPSVLQAMAKPLVGHLDPTFLQLMDEVKSMLRHVLRTENAMTFPVSGTGSAGMEFCLVNLIEPWDKVLVAVNGVFGARMADVAERCGAQVTKVEASWGEIIQPQQIEAALEEAKPDLVALVHAETSTGVWNPVEEIAPLVRESGAFLLLDTVTSLAGSPVDIDGWGVDAVYSGTQKCLSCPPGLAPVSLSERAVEKVRGRKTKVQSWYLDLNLLASYWGNERAYHHTAPISMNYALHEALRLVLEEGLEARWERHRTHHLALKKGLEAMGLRIASQEGHQLWQLNAVAVPEGVDEAAVRKALLNEHHIEVGAGLGPMKGKIWRVGLMGATCTQRKLERFLSALGEVLTQNGHPVNVDKALTAARQ